MSCDAVILQVTALHPHSSLISIHMTGNANGLLPADTLRHSFHSQALLNLSVI